MGEGSVFFGEVELEKLQFLHEIIGNIVYDA